MEKAARELAGQRSQEAKALGQEARAKVTLENLFAQLESTTNKVLKLVVKADTQGSVEAIQGALERIGNDEVGAQVLSGGVGGITESDVILAHASGAAILGFNVRANNQARERAAETLDMVRKAMKIDFPEMR